VSRDALDAFFAGSSGHRIRGPKSPAMEIIDELKARETRALGGGVGYFSAGGEMDMSCASDAGYKIKPVIFKPVWCCLIQRAESNIWNGP